MSSDKVCGHILAASVAMVGVCITVITLVKVFGAAARINTLIDELMAVDSVLFLVSGSLSYLALRTERGPLPLTRYADVIFLLGLLLMIAASFMLAWEIGAG
ncbi:MAG: hypothetical protein ACOY5C_14095 [Pseudomonadota bacterium]|uniref:hypothetical protein n=1 Tax=Thermithiobacillus tepidarius TaxID=929 RepID=UPI0003FB8182|nr:hypothetical protein [Thermithiobacillus tepidarius]